MKNFYIALFLLYNSISYSQSPCPGIDSLNYGNQWYHTVQIGTQCWLKENLNIGKMILAVKDQINNDTIEKFCYNNDSNMCSTYGGLYEWREAVQYSQKQETRGICPIGWHIPNKTQFDSLILTVNGDVNALLTAGQGDGTNSSGFSGLMGGSLNTYYETPSYKLFVAKGTWAYFWISNTLLQGPGNGGYYNLFGDQITLQLAGGVWTTHGSTSHYAEDAISVRCLKDNAELILQSPFGKESWQVGSIHKISWGGNLDNKKIKLEYSIDSGISWLTIIDSTPAIEGDYNWVIPNYPSQKCKIKITDLNDPNSFSISDNLFTIYSSCPVGSTIEHGGKTYHIVVIANKCWFKENLNIGKMIPSSQQSITKGILEKYCYNDDSANCEKYGGLYSFSEALEDGICPTFWHLPANNPFETLISSVIYDANAIKAESQGSGYGEGTNFTGFTSLLAGHLEQDGKYYGLGRGAWFLTGDNDRFINSDNNLFGGLDYYNSPLAASGRCVMDDIGPLLLTSPIGGENWLIGSTQKISWTLSNVINIKIDYTTDNGTSWINIVPSLSASLGSYNWIIPNTPSKNCKIKISSVMNPDTNSICNNIFRIYRVSTDSCPGIPTIKYAGQIYNTIAIGDQCWLKENLNVGIMINASQGQSNNGILEKYCYNNDTNNCSRYGGLYLWNEAMQYNTVENSKGICPDGWHIPSWGEFINLLTYVDNIENDLLEVGQGSGTNASGFSALLGGDSYQDNFNYFDKGSYYWSSTSYEPLYAYCFILLPDNNTNVGGASNKLVGTSIRCIYNKTISGVNKKIDLPKNFELFNAYPNPFNPTTTIRYQVPTNVQVTIKVFDALGRELSILVSEEKSAGNYEVTFNGRNLSSGIYYYQMKAANFIETKKIILLK